MILIDVAHPAHVHFFRPLAETLLSDGIDVRIVGRDKDVTVRLLEASGLPFEVLPMGRSGAGRLAGAIELVRRSVALRRRIRHWDTKIVLTRNPSGVLAAVGTTATSVFDTDDGRTVGLHYWTARPFADVITSSVHDPEFHGSRHRRYRALKAQMFLHPDRFTPDREVRRRYLEDGAALSVVRFSAHDASHDHGIEGLSAEARTAILQRLTALGRILLSVERGGLHLLLPDTPATESLEVAPEHFHDLLATADLCVGDSQSVAAEAAILGVPTLRLSGFSGRTFYLELLESRGLMENFRPGEEASMFSALELLIDDSDARTARSREEARQLNQEAEDLVAWFVRLVHEILEGELRQDPKARRSRSRGTG